MAAALDLAIIIAYLTIILGFALVIGRRENLEGFLVNNRKTRSIFLMFSIVSSSVGAGALIGVAGTAYSSGISFGISTLITMVLGLSLIALIAPRIKSFGDRFKAYTIGDFAGIRFSLNTRLLISALTIVAFFIFTGAQFVAIASLANVLLDIDFTVALIGAAVLTIAYTAFAGLKGDIYTDFIQFIVITIALFAALLPFGILKTGIPSLPAGHFDMFAFAGPIFFFGSIFLGGLYLTASMDWWQRVYASQSRKQARRVFTYGAILAVPFYLLPIGLGLMAFGSLGPGTDPDIVLFRFMESVLPVGLLGIGYAGLLAAVMSTVDTTIIVSTTSFFKDFFKTLVRPRMNNKRLLLHARIFAVVFGVSGIATAYLLPSIVDLVLISVFIIGTFIPAVIGGLFWKRSTSKGAFLSILFGFAILVIFLFIEPRMAWVPAILISTIVLIVVSKITQHSESEKIINLNK